MKKLIFEFENYKNFVHHWIQQMPKRGYGQLQKIAKHLGISSVSVSHVFNGPRDLTEEQALELCDFLALDDLESEYFQLLVRKSRAGTSKLKNSIQKKIESIQEKSKDLKSRIPQDLELNELAAAQFYSRWEYAAISLLVDIDGFQTVEALSEYLRMPRSQVRQMTDFLVQYGLCKKQNSELRMGPKRTHLDSNSLLSVGHRINWRLKGFEHQGQLSAEELFYTGPMVLSHKTMAEVRKKIVELIAEAVALVEPSASEQLACLNIDWFKVQK